MKIGLSADHAGYEQLKALQIWLQGKGHECLNFGPTSLDAEDDYPDYIFPAAKAVAGGQCEKGVVIGGSGQGEAMAANRLKGVRCAVLYGPAVAKGIVEQGGRISHDPYEIVRLSRQHNDANMLSLAARFMDMEQIKAVVELWLTTPFSGEERHQRRINKLDEAA